MKKGKKIKELDDWLDNSKDEEFEDNSDDVAKDYEEVTLDSDFEYILTVDNNLGDFEYKSNGVQDYVLNKLKKKSVTDIKTQIDLHGETIKDSISKLNDFFSYAYTNDIKFIKIICGKGKNSMDKIPKIKITAQAFIKTCNIVNAACTARDRDGGIGVLKVKLRN